MSRKMKNDISTSFQSLPALSDSVQDSSEIDSVTDESAEEEEIASANSSKDVSRRNTSNVSELEESNTTIPESDVESEEQESTGSYKDPQAQHFDASEMEESKTTIPESDVEMEEQESARSHKQFEESQAQYSESSDDLKSDDDMPVGQLKKSAPRRIQSDSESSNDEDKLRKSLYDQEESEDDDPCVENRAYSKATRRSISGYNPEKCDMTINSGSDSDSDESALIENEDEETRESKQAEDTNWNSSMEGQPSSIEEEKNEKSDLKTSIDNIDDEESNKENHQESSRISEKSQPFPELVPLREHTTKNRKSMEENESFDESIHSLLSSTLVTGKDGNSETVDLTGFCPTGAIHKSIKSTVSKSFYESKVAEKETIERQLEATMKILNSKHGLPDGGAKLRKNVDRMLSQMDKITEKIESMEIDVTKSVKAEIVKSFQSNHVSIGDDSTGSVPESSEIAWKELHKVQDVQPKFTGKVGMKNFETQKALTAEKLEVIQQSIDQRPAEDVLAKQPKYLKVDLMEHQLHALTFMQWRETQRPRGGILADDMGLGKTLSTIAHVLKQYQDNEEQEDSDSDSDVEKDNGWKSKGRKELKPGGTLVICPASLLKQWEYEVQNKVKRGALEVNLFHGINRCHKARTLAKYDIVITTYQTVASEKKVAENDGILYQIKWDRIVLDEGHVIRNHKSKQCEAVCELHAKKRWVLTGTPVHNKEFDLYATIKFLRCTPFDDLHYWKTWIEVKKGAGTSPRIAALLKSLLIRRTKQQLMEGGSVANLPSKRIEEIRVTLNRDERFVYSRLLALSQTIFQTYLAQRLQKDHMGSYEFNRDKMYKMHKQFARMVGSTHEVQSHEILTLILRLRQACCHPGLIKEMVEKTDLADLEMEQCDENNDSRTDLLDMMKKLNMNDGDDDNHAVCRKFSIENPVFSYDVPSSKIETMMNVLRERVLNTSDKAIIVSQWVSFLNIAKGMLESEGVRYCELNGSVKIKDRNDVVIDFNDPKSRTKVMLLSLTAGGVGLNLIGANYLFLLDLHWNPQLEQQAQDRIYRFGQTKDVVIIKFICDETIEEAILATQLKKMEIATSTLTGAKKSGTSLSIDDLKAMFQLA